MHGYRQPGDGMVRCGGRQLRRSGQEGARVDPMGRVRGQGAARRDRQGARSRHPAHAHARRPNQGRVHVQAALPDLGCGDQLPGAGSRAVCMARSCCWEALALIAAVRRDGVCRGAGKGKLIGMRAVLRHGGVCACVHKTFWNANIFENSSSPMPISLFSDVGISSLCRAVSCISAARHAGWRRRRARAAQAAGWSAAHGFASHGCGCGRS
mmetsp:Transcript_53319/g.111304  ORF Transcript_53319/g.111304 Transcript_53319/m.111304 type:complete len:211 (-) Transcript_53319:1452-2084(-)